MHMHEPKKLKVRKLTRETDLKEIQHRLRYVRFIVSKHRNAFGEQFLIVLGLE